MIAYPQKVFESGGSVWVSPSPAQYTIHKLSQFDVIINVSDSPGISLSQGQTQTKPGAIHHWFPIQEACQWYLGNLDAICLALDEYVTKRQLKVLVHCHGGACRAPTVVQLWLQTRELATNCHQDIAQALHRGQIEAFDLQVLRSRKHSAQPTDSLAAHTDQEKASARWRLHAPTG